MSLFFLIDQTSHVDEDFQKTIALTDMSKAVSYTHLDVYKRQG